MEGTGSGASEGWNRDTVVGVGAALVLVGAMAGVFLYERGQFQEYEISWEPAAVQTLEDSQTLSEGESATYDVEATTDGMAHLRADLSWSDGTGEADTFNLAVEDPNGTTSEDSSDSSPLEVAVDVNPRPSVTTASGRSPEEARQQANASVDSTAGQGTWTVTVTLESAPGTEGTGGVGSQEDGAQDYSVTIAVERWTPQVQSGG